MFLPCGHDIDTGGIDTAVAQNVCQFRNILFDAVECPCEKFPQIVGKHLAFLDPGSFTQLLHLTPDTATVKGITVSSDKDCTGYDATAFRIVQQDILQLTRNEDRPVFAFAADCDLPTAYRFNGKELQLGHPDTSSANGLENQVQLFVFLRS